MPWPQSSLQLARGRAENCRVRFNGNTQVGRGWHTAAERASEPEHKKVSEAASRPTGQSVLNDPIVAD